MATDQQAEPLAARLFNQAIIDLTNRVPVGTHVTAVQVDRSRSGRDGAGALGRLPYLFSGLQLGYGDQLGQLS